MIQLKTTPAAAAAAAAPLNNQMEKVYFPINQPTLVLHTTTTTY